MNTADDLNIIWLKRRSTNRQAPLKPQRIIYPKRWGLYTQAIKQLFRKITIHVSYSFICDSIDLGKLLSGCLLTAVSFSICTTFERRSCRYN